MTARRIGPRPLAAIATLMLALLWGAGPVSAQAPPAQDTNPLTPVDPQAWVDQADLTWADYTQVRPDEWHDPAVQGSERQFTGAVVLADFEDEPFLIAQEPETHPFGNPQPGWEPVSDVNQWMHEYLTVPNEYNGGQTIHSYWMEDSHGTLGVHLDTFGPYTLPGKLHEYGLSGFGRPVGNQANSLCPAGDSCNKNLRTHANNAWVAAEGQGIGSQYDFIFYVSAAHDESSTWQEQGEMLFQTRDDVPAAFGPPGAEDGPVLNNAGNPITNWAGTRYVPWTSWRAAGNHWPNATSGSSTQAESSGQSVYAHEFSHILGLPDNYNNPFADNIRNYTGYWEMMSRGTFNGPGGTHNRWQVPNQGGSGLGPHHLLHFKRQLGVLEDEDVVQVERSLLPMQGVARATLKARTAVPDGDQVGLQVTLPPGGYQSGQCESQTDDPSFWCPPGSNWTSYSMEVVDRVGNDSFTPGHGVLLAQNRTSGTPRIWLIDPNPDDIDMIDFYRPDGTPVPVVRGDPRQLNTATWHAGTDSGSEFEYIEEFNRLHFYVLDTHRDEDGVLFYDVAVRHLDGAGVFERGVELGDATVSSVGWSTALVQVPLTNTGDGGGLFGGLFDSDVYRLSASIEGEGWELWLPYEVKAAEAGETVLTQAYVTRQPDSARSATLTLTATSETDPSATTSVTIELDAQDAGPGRFGHGGGDGEHGWQSGCNPPGGGYGIDKSPVHDCPDGD